MMELIGHFCGYSITVDVYHDGEALVAVYPNTCRETVDRLFSATPAQIYSRLEELDGTN